MNISETKHIELRDHYSSIRGVSQLIVSMLKRPAAVEILGSQTLNKDTVDIFLDLGQCITSVTGEKSYEFLL